MVQGLRTVACESKDDQSEDELHRSEGRDNVECHFDGGRIVKVLGIGR